MRVTDLDGSGDSDRAIRGGSLGFLVGFLYIRVDGNLKNNFTTANFLALKGLDCLLLLLLGANIDKAIALGTAWLSPATADDASSDDSDSGLGEERGEGGVVDVEAEVRDEQHSLGGFAYRGLTRSSSRLGSLREPWLPLLPLFGSGGSSGHTISGTGSGVAFNSTGGSSPGLPGLVALKGDSMSDIRDERNAKRN